MSKCVYVICCEKNQRRYVGQTILESQPERRMARHIRSAAAGSTFPFHTAIRELGAEHFYVEKIYKTDSELILNKVEALWAELYNAYVWSSETDPDLPPAGYNSALAGFSNKMRGRKHTPAALEKMAAARRRYWAARHSSSAQESPDGSSASDDSVLSEALSEDTSSGT